MVEGLLAIKYTKGICKGCIVCKHHESKFDWGKESRAKSILEMIHYDINRSMPTTSMNRYRYVLTFKDDFSRYTWIFFIKKKFEVLEKFIELKALVENASERKIKYFRYDNGGEYISSEFLEICSYSGIKIQQSILYTPLQNGVAERKNDSLKEMTTCMLEAKGLAANLWDDSINVSAYI